MVPEHHHRRTHARPRTDDTQLGLGEGLRRAVDKAGLNGVQAAHELGWSTSKVSRLLSGKRGGDEVEVSAPAGGVQGEGQGAQPAARALP